MIGFKSFADYQSIEFVDGINAIVGPNGCGKSNVADAVRWVLGEQSSKILRGTCMQDVIFKGTEKRKGLSFCEVSLYFDNTNKIFNSDYEEIVITRKLYKNGDCEYFLNKASCRLRDIQDILYDSGVGKTGYSIIAQGMVDKIINSKPEERRVVFEDAAGISKFKVKKVEAERRLERTQDNLNQINLVIGEIDRQLKPLKAQSDTAKIYLELKEKLKLLEVNAYIYQYDYASVNKEQILAKIQGLVEEINYKTAELEKATSNYNNTFNSINNIDRTISELKDKILYLTVEIEKRTGAVNVEREKCRALKNDESRLNLQIESLNTDLQKMTEQRQNAETSLNNKQNTLITLKHELMDTEDKYKNVVEELKAGEDEAQESQRQLFDALAKLGDVKAQISALEVEKENYTQNLNTYNEESDNLNMQFHDISAEETKAFNDLQLAKSEKDQIEQDLTNKMREQNEMLANIKSMENKIYELNSNILSLEQKQNLLTEMAKEYDGYNGSVKRLLLDAEKSAELRDKIVGVVASLISVPEKYQTAVEMSLGSAVQNIVTHTDTFAKDLIKYLKMKEYGRVTFLPLNTIKPRYFDGQFRGLLNADGAIGLACDLISYDPKIKNVISNLLGTTLIVDNINNAVTIAMRSNYSFRIVTLDGDIINPQGSITGGSKKSAVTNLLSRDAEIANTKQLIEKLSQNKADLSSEYDKFVENHKKLTDEIANLTTSLHEVEVNSATLTQVYSKLNSDLRQNEENRNKVLANISKAKSMLESIDNKLNELKDSNIAVSNIEQVSFAELKQKRDEYVDIITNSRVQIASTEQEINSLIETIDRLKSQIDISQSSLQSATTQLNAVTSELSTISDVIKQSSEQIDSSPEHIQLNEVKARLNNIEEEKLALSNSLRDYDEQKLRFSEELHKIQDKKYQQDLALTKIDTDIEAMQERVWTEYELTYNTALAYKQDMFDLKAGMQEISKVKKEINALGNVNVNAIEDYKALEERFGTMYSQAQDLIKAEDDLKKVIKELSEEMSTRFISEFNKINTNFGIVFKELFGGGTAKLQLIDSDNVLEAGVDIVAEPPEKKLSNITLLSGGEKALVAIAILFAIIRLRPIPFCLLDEIEAPLDEANVTRFAEYIRKYCHETQFVVITHKKPTMEHADVLFGVTMEEKGVSKIVSVKLSDAIKDIEERG